VGDNALLTKKLFFNSTFRRNAIVKSIIVRIVNTIGVNKQINQNKLYEQKRKIPIIGILLVDLLV